MENDTFGGAILAWVKSAKAFLKVQAATGDNLLDCDIREGFTDYCLWSTFRPECIDIDGGSLPLAAAPALPGLPLPPLRGLRRRPRNAPLDFGHKLCYFKHTILSPPEIAKCAINPPTTLSSVLHTHNCYLPA